MSRRDAIVVLVLWLAASAFNLTKAVHIDDTAYLEIARILRTDPLHVMSAELSWFDEREPVHAVNQPHFFMYFLTAVLVGFGEWEVGFHLVMALFTLLAIASFHALARRMTSNQAGYLTALFALGPALLPGQNLMCDVPMMALWLLCLVALTAPNASMGSRPGTAVVAGLAAAAACLTKYTSLVLLPVLALDAFWRRQWRCLLGLLVPVVTLMGWSLFNYLDYGGVHLLGRPVPTTRLAHYFENFLAYLICLGSVTPFTLLLLAQVRRSSVARWAMLVALGAGSSFRLWHPTVWQDEPSRYALRTGFLANGTLALTWFLLTTMAKLRRGMWRPTEERRPDLLLRASGVGAFAFIFLFSPFLAVRHVLPLVAVCLLLLGREVLPGTRAVVRSGVLVATLLLGTALAASDWLLADVYRRFAPAMEAEARAAAVSPDSTVWYVGHWGWQWYAERAGMVAYDRKTSELREGDCVVIPETVPRQLFAPADRRRLQRLGAVTIEATYLSRVRTFSRKPLGGYYALRVWELPWEWRNDVLEEFTLFRVGPAAP